ncbi:MAG: hypothetical protein ACYTXA_04475 [Nostoc sp.]
MKCAVYFIRAIAYTVLSSQRSQCHTVQQPEHLSFNQKRRRWRSLS